MSALLYPTASLNELFFEHHVGNFMATMEKIEALFFSSMQESGQTSSIPVLTCSTIAKLPPWSLVRFRGMVQDMGTETELCQVSLDPSTKQTTIYREDYCDLFTGETDQQAGFVERCRLHCVSVPGQTQWATNLYESSSISSSEAFRNDAHCSAITRKRDLNAAAEGPSGGCASKRCRVTNGDVVMDTTTISEAPSHQSSSTGDGYSQLDCILKMYCVGERKYSLNDIVEVIGILHPNISGDQAMKDSDNDFLEDQQFDIAVGSVRCSIHALHLTKCISVIGRAPRQPFAAEPHILHQQLLATLTKFMAGDSLAATYLLLHMFSGVYDRKGSLIMGNLPLNFMGPKADVACRGAQFAWDLLVEQYGSVQLDLVSLQATPLLPIKDFQRDCLRIAPLQLAPKTFLAIDETALAEGRLNEQGLRNLAHLKGIMEAQTATYDFQYHTMEIETDYPSIIFSCSKSLLHTSCFCVVPFQPEVADPDFATLRCDFQEEQLPVEQWRTLISFGQRQPSYNITEAVKTAIEEDIAHEMNEHPERFNRSPVIHHNTLHLWFTLARLLTLSRGETELSIQTWNDVKALEAQRVHRLSK